MAVMSVRRCKRASTLVQFGSHLIAQGDLLLESLANPQAARTMCFASAALEALSRTVYGIIHPDDEILSASRFT